MSVNSRVDASPWWRSIGKAVLGTELCFLLALVLVASSPLAAQLSPGPLSEPHAELEGSSGCLECHSSGRGVDPERCLSCHLPLAERLVANRGLHARPEYADCKTCHIEHHGREFELVWWGEEGRDAFDHELTGFTLVGRHGDIGCRDCHRPERIRSPSALLAQGKDLDRTFLGLGTACLDCHRDEHRGQFAGDDCLSCHVQTGWAPAPRFDHRRARFVLTGRHRQVACEECHRSVDQPLAADAGFVRFRGLAFETCSDCHRDPHAGRFGGDCNSCHGTDDWRAVDVDRFDHDLTRYPLEGRHRPLACEACHRRGEPRRGLAFASCTDCHRDEHAGQLAARTDGGSCESCHDVEGFVPALYSRADHEAVFVLSGAHFQLDCSECHRRQPAAGLVRQGALLPADATGREEVLRLRMPAASCTDCHQDPHGGSTAEVAPRGCSICHVEERWQSVTFDHALTDFALTGPHARPTCRECHAPDSKDPPRLDFAGLTTECVACHSDPHRSQFAGEDGRTDCLRCHDSTQWKPALRFDHARDARFPLEGAHGRLGCASCHREVGDDLGVWVHYRPLGRNCIDCHGGR